MVLFARPRLPLLTLCAFALVACGAVREPVPPPPDPAPACAGEPHKRPPQAPKSAVTKALIHGGTLWLLDAKRILWSIDLSAPVPERALFSARVSDIHVMSGKLHAVALSDSGDVWEVWRLDSDWREVSALPAGECPDWLSLSDAAGLPVLLAAEALYVPSGRVWLRKDLSRRLPAVAPTSVVCVPPGRCFLGYAVNESRESLYRVDLRTAESTAMPFHGLGESCSPRKENDVACDSPFVIRDPSMWGCVLVAVDSWPERRGRIARLCDETMIPVFDTPPPEKEAEALDDHTPIVRAFYARPDGLGVLTERSLYEVSPSTVRRIDVPELKPFAGIRAAQDIAGVFLFAVGGSQSQKEKPAPILAVPR